MGERPQTDDEPFDAGRHLRYLSREVRGAGDMGLVLLSEDGVSTISLTLADELWLVAHRIDGKLTDG